jgi:hypothetical protein
MLTIKIGLAASAIPATPQGCTDYLPPTSIAILATPSLLTPQLDNTYGQIYSLGSREKASPSIDGEYGFAHDRMPSDRSPLPTFL